MGLAAGKLDRRITLQRATVTQSASTGESVEAWDDLATVWGSAAPVSDGERVRAAEVAAEITMRFRIRYWTGVADLNPKDRVRFDGRTYGIVGVKELGRREGLEISAVARAD